MHWKCYFKGLHQCKAEEPQICSNSRMYHFLNCQSCCWQKILFFGRVLLQMPHEPIYPWQNPNYIFWKIMQCSSKVQTFSKSAMRSKWDFVMLIFILFYSQNRRVRLIFMPIDHFRRQLGVIQFLWVHSIHVSTICFFFFNFQLF